MNPPPFLVLFEDVEQLLNATDPDAKAQYGHEIRRLATKNLPPVVSRRCLAAMFGYSSKFIGDLQFRSHAFYRTFTIPKGKKKRTIQAPKVALKVVQKWFGYHLAKAVPSDDTVFGFVEGKSVFDAAKRHCGADWIYSVDIANFFQTTPLKKIEEALQNLGYSRHGATLIGQICCYDGMLAQGSPASPILSNLAFRQADASFGELAERFRVQHTRYADDIVFSGHGDFPPEIQQQTRKIIEQHGWKISDGKERVAKRPNRLKVHGMLVHNDMPRLTKGYRNKLRAFAYLIANNRVSGKDAERMQGHMAYSAFIERKSGE